MPLFVIPQILLCGLFVPRSALPDVLRAVSDVLPLSYATDAMQTLVTTSATGEVWRDLGIVVAFAVGGARPRRGDPAPAYPLTPAYASPATK